MRTEITTDYGEDVVVTGRATVAGGAHLFVFVDGETPVTVSLSVPQVVKLRKALKKAAGL